MNCSFCTGLVVPAYNYNRRKQGISICESCHEEVNKMMQLMNIHKTGEAAATNSGTKNATKWVEQAKQREEGWNSYLSGLAVAFREKSYSDILVKPGNGPAIPAHRVLLAASSEVFKTMLASDLCKSAPTDSVSLPKFKHDELETFLEFLYCGKLSKEKFEKHFYSLLLAADKYVVPRLQRYCEQHVRTLLDSSNALKILKASEICSNEIIKAAALESILSHTKEIYFSPSFEEFVRLNPRLMVHIVKAHHSEKETLKQGIRGVISVQDEDDDEDDDMGFALFEDDD